MRVLIDTNVILDVLFARDSFVGDSVAVLHMCEDEGNGYITAKAITDIYYFLRKNLKSEKKARQAISKLMDILHVCDVTMENLREALSISNEDYEDAIAVSCAKAAGCELIITRDKKHFKGTGIKCITPSEYVY